MPVIITLCDECKGKMRIDLEMDMVSDISVCSRCNDKPVDEITDGVAVGSSMEINPRQLKGDYYV